MAGRWCRQRRPPAWLTGRLSGVVLAFAGALSGEEAFDGAFDPRHALGQRLHVLTNVGYIAADLGKVGAHFASQGLAARAPASFVPRRTPLTSSIDRRGVAHMRPISPATILMRNRRWLYPDLSWATTKLQTDAILNDAQSPPTPQEDEPIEAPGLKTTDCRS